MHKIIQNQNRQAFTGGRRELRRRSGFSMLELILVLAIVIVIAALAAPAVDGTINRQSIVSATDRVRVAMGQARVKAIRTGEVHALFYQRGGQWFDVAPLSQHAQLPIPQSNNVSLSTRNRELNENWLPRQVRFAAGQAKLDFRSQTAKEASDGAPVDAILFYPDGTSQDARILLQDDRSSLMAVELRGLTGMAKTIRSVSRNGQGLGAR